MNLLRKSLGRAKILDTNHQDSGDKNDQNNTNVDSKSISAHTQKRSLRDPVNEYMVKMLNLIKELAIFCLVFMAYAAITNDPPKVSKAPAAYPFFPKNSLVKDFYRGQIIAAIEHARTTDLSFIMFYAPWDAQSQTARQEFLIAADYMKDYVIFTAVNCWQPGSECRNQYNKVYSWPVLIVYPTFGTGIQYNGPISAPHMISFLQKLMRPIKRINESNLNYEEAYIVAELNTLPGSMEYSVYYSTALKYLEADYVARVSFFVKPVKYSQNKISLYLWNQVRVLDIEPGDWKVETILQWIIKTTESPSLWVTPSGSKSLMLSDNLLPGPTLILFTPKNPLHLSTDYYMMLQEIAQEYKNCDNWGLSFDIKTKRLSNSQMHNKLKNICRSKHRFPSQNKISSVTTAVPFLNSTTKIKARVGDKLELDYNMLGLDPKISHVCQNLKQGECYDVLPQLSIVHEENGSPGAIKELMGEPGSYVTSMLRQDSDPKSMQNLRKTWRKARCKAFLAAEKLYSSVFEPTNASDDNNAHDIDLSSLSCSNSNQSLNFFAMDSLLYYMFAERLGVDLSKKKDKSAVVILNEKMETHYLLQDTITSTNLRLFIRNFSNNSLSRSLDSSVDVPSKFSPQYPFKTSSDNDSPQICVDELNSKNFLKTVLEDKKAILVMYYSKQCSYCNGISYVFLTVARKLSLVENVKFTRIDGDINILPWEYTMEEFPTILFFPSNMKEETRVFPSDIPITVPHLLGFILSNVDAPLRLHVMYSVCLHNQIQKDKNTCLTTVRNETISLIEKTLKDWRKSNNRQRQLLLHNLKQLRQLQFLFSHSPDDHLGIETYFKKLKVYLSEDYTQNSNSKVKDEL